MIDRQREREICKGYSSWKAIGIVSEVLCEAIFGAGGYAAVPLEVAV
jgi:hypothetical protein